MTSIQQLKEHITRLNDEKLLNHQAKKESSMLAKLGSWKSV